jgi:hypothetical protein
MAIDGRAGDDGGTWASEGRGQDSVAVGDDDNGEGCGVHFSDWASKRSWGERRGDSPVSEV